MVVFVNYFSRKLKKGIANRKICKKKKRRWKNNPPPPKSLRSYCSTWEWEILLIPSLYEKFESFNQSVATSWVPIMCALVQGRVSFTLDTIYEIWQRQFSKVIEFRFKSCFLHYWLSTSGKFLNLSTPQFPHLQKGDDTLVLLWRCLYNTDLGYGTLGSALQWSSAGFFLTSVHVALCTFILSYTQLRPSNYAFLGR